LGAQAGGEEGSAGEVLHHWEEADAHGGVHLERRSETVGMAV
jgi:hypothetical protein